MKPNDLYDPEANDLMSLLDDSMMPSKEFAGPALLRSLQNLGLRKRLSCEGVLESARSIETLIGSSHINSFNNIARKRSTALLQYLDNDETLKELLNECRTNDDKDIIGERVEPSPVTISRSLNSYEGRFITELNEIAWLPVEIEYDASQNNDCRPPRRNQVSKSVASTAITRPKSEEWLCSYSMETLTTSIRSDILKQCFGWDKTLPVIIIASQLLALSKAWEESEKTIAFRQVLATIIPRCYEILHNHMGVASLDEKEKMLIALQEKPWVWVGDQFVTSSQVAFDAPENARPYLFSIPQESLCFDALFKCCGVRETFDAQDFIKLTQDLSSKLQSCIGNSKQIDLAIGKQFEKNTLIQRRSIQPMQTPHLFLHLS